MYYLPLPILKILTFCGAILTLLIAISMLAFTIYSYTTDNVPIKQINKVQGQIMLPLIFSETIIIVFCFLGIFGVKKGKRYLVIIFSIVVVVFIAIFLILGFMSYYVPNHTFRGQCSDVNVPWLNNASKAFTQGNWLCTIFCPCTMNIYDDYSQQELKLLDKWFPYRNSSKGLIKLQQCPNLVIDKYIRQIFNPLGHIQKFFHCTGWCNETIPGQLLIYKFSDVNNKIKPQDYCFPRIKMYINKYGSIVLYFCLGISFVLLLVFFCSFCLCKHPSRVNIITEDHSYVRLYK